MVSTGPYRFVRHPCYSGSLLGNLGVPWFLDSTWAWAGVVALVVITVVRTVLEDRKLRADLPGYDEYARRVRHRLVPRIW